MKTITSKDGLSIAYRYLPGDEPTVMFMPGFFSNMEGTKARWLEQCCRERGQAYVRFDYRGHGVSGGKFEDGKKHLLLHNENPGLDIPVCLIHGKQDNDVSWQKSSALQQKIGKDRCELILVPDGEHRLSRQQDLELIGRVVRDVSARCG